MKLPQVFQDHMVLQRDVVVSVWGWAEPGAPVTVFLAGRRSQTRAAADGRWRLSLEPLNAGGPFELVVASGEHERRLEVFVGEVWFCAGQSNMAMSVEQCGDLEAESAVADGSAIHLFETSSAWALLPQPDVPGKWIVCDRYTVGRFPATAYHFARHLRRELNVPIGLLHASLGDTPAAAWMSREALLADPETHPILARWESELDALRAGSADLMEAYRRWQKDKIAYGDLERAWTPAAREARNRGGPLPPRPVRPRSPLSPQSPTLLWNGRIAPLTHHAIRGFLWYQGETDAIQGNARRYRALFRSLIRDWRRAWDRGDLPFLFVQLANHADIQSECPERAWPEVREAQLLALEEPNTAMAVAIDIGESDAIHPRNKREVGRRLALAALAKAYGRAIEYSGPLFDRISADASTLRLHFRHTAAGLITRGSDELLGFEVVHHDGRSLPASARIDGPAVVISTGPESASVRYGWSDDPKCNLYNSAGLPASPFRTDTRPGDKTL